MATCVYCGAETKLHVTGRPVCANCDETTQQGKKPGTRERAASSSENVATTTQHQENQDL